MRRTFQHACIILESTRDKNRAYVKELTILCMSRGSALGEPDVYLEICHFLVKVNLLLSNMGLVTPE